MEVLKTSNDIESPANSVSVASGQGTANTTQAEIAAIVERHDGALNLGYLDHGLDVKLWDELRQLSAVR